MKYFTEKDFKKCVPSCSLSDMDFSFMCLLDLARGFAGVPFVLNSAYRSVDWELTHGRAGTSSHCKGVAVDIRCSSTVQRYIIVRSLILAGFSRIGISKSFVHVDLDASKPDCIWLY